MQVDRPLVGQSLPEEQEELQLAEGWVQDYLDRLSAPLLGFVPIKDRLRFVEEIRQNLENRRDDFERAGMSPAQAVKAALDKVGSPQRAGESFVYEYQRHKSTGVLARYAGKPVWWAFVLFGQAGILALGLLFARMYLVQPEPNTFGMTVSEIRRIIPETLPLPDKHITWHLLWVYAFIAPVAAGVLLGFIAPFSNVRPALAAAGAASLLSFALCSYIPSVWEGTVLAYFQLVWWMPVGALSAFVGSSLAIRHRRAQDPWNEKKQP